MMYSIEVLAAFDFLPEEIVIGILDYERVKGNPSYRFQYDKGFLASFPNISLSADLGKFLGDFLQRIQNSYVDGYQAGKEESKDEGMKEQAFETVRALLELGVSTESSQKALDSLPTKWNHCASL